MGEGKTEFGNEMKEVGEKKGGVGMEEEEEE